jgi:hypothetical protein
MVISKRAGEIAMNMVHGKTTKMKATPKLDREI